MCSVFRSWENSPYAPPRVRFSLPGLHVSENSVRPCGAAGGSLIFCFCVFLVSFSHFSFHFRNFELEVASIVAFRVGRGSGMGRGGSGYGSGMGRAWVGAGRGPFVAESSANLTMFLRNCIFLVFFG